MAVLIFRYLRKGYNIISTVPIDIDFISKGGRKPIGDYLYIPINEMNTDKLYEYMVLMHEKGVEGQTKVFIDECQIIFNSRHWNQLGRMDWIVFMSTHRHLGFDIFLITQNDGFIDKQIRPLIETEIKTKKVSNWLWFIPGTIFVQREEWYGHTQKVKIQSGFVRGRNKYFNVYDSYTIFREVFEKYASKFAPKQEEPA
jgi:hypothetical protein